MTDPDHELAVGVLGGMGPEATADFLAKLVAATPVEREQDHLRVFVDCNPKVPDRNRAMRGEAEEEGASAGAVLAAMAAGLERAGAGFVVMACNTAHAFAADIRAALGVPFVSMVDETVDACIARHAHAMRIGLLAAQGCLDARLYQDAFAAHGRTTLVLDDDAQARFMALLYRIKRGNVDDGKRDDDVREPMRALAASLVDAGADIVVAACTEVPLVLDAHDVARPLVDPAVELAARCVRYARRLEALPSIPVRC